MIAAFFTVGPRRSFGSVDGIEADPSKSPGYRNFPTNRAEQKPKQGRQRHDQTESNHGRPPFGMSGGGNKRYERGYKSIIYNGRTQITPQHPRSRYAGIGNENRPRQQYKAPRGEKGRRRVNTDYRRQGGNGAAHGVSRRSETVRRMIASSYMQLGSSVRWGRPPHCRCDGAPLAPMRHERRFESSDCTGSRHAERSGRVGLVVGFGLIGGSSGLAAPRGQDARALSRRRRGLPGTAGVSPARLRRAEGRHEGRAARASPPTPRLAETCGRGRPRTQEVRACGATEFRRPAPACAKPP